MRTDAALLEQYARDRDPAAFAELVERHAGMVYGAALRVTRDPHDAEDVAQECFLQLARHAHTIRSTPAGWLHRTATNRAVSALRSAGARRRHEHRAVEPVTETGEPRWEEISPHVDRALSSLPDDMRAALVAHYLEGRTQAEVAEGLGVSQPTVSRRIRDGVEALRKALSEAGVVAPAAVVTAGLAGQAAVGIPAHLAAELGKMALSGVGSATAHAAAAGVGAKVTAGIAGAVAVAAVVHLTATTLRQEPEPPPAPAAPPVATAPAPAAIPAPPEVEEQEEEAEMASVVREDGKVYLTGMEDTDWGGSYGGAFSFFTLQDSFMGALVPILRCAGRDVTYADVMGLSAQAFKLTLPESLHPGAAQGHVGYAVFDEDGTPVTPEGAYGPMSFHGNAMRVFGMEWSHIDLNPEETPDWREQLLAAVRESADKGVPIFYMDGEWGLIVGYREDGSAFLCRYIGARPGYHEMERPRGCIGDAWWANVAALTKEPVPHEQAVRESLHSAVIGARTASIGDGDVANGFAAYELWIRVLEEWPDDGRGQGNLFNYGQLRTSREAAGHYLRGIAEDWTGRPDESFQAAGEHLHAAADRYIAISDRLFEERDCAVWWREGWGAEDRATEIEVLRACLTDERQAVAEIEAALAALRG